MNTHDGSRLNLFVVHVPTRLNPIINRLNKTKVVRDVDHEAERAERIKRDAAARKALAQAKVSIYLFSNSHDVASSHSELA